MNGREIIKDIMEKQNITNATLANRLNITQAALWDRIDTQPRKAKPRKDIPVSLLSEMVQVMDYKIMIVPSNTRLPNEGYIIESAGKEESSKTDKSISTESTKSSLDSQTAKKPIRSFDGRIKLTPVLSDPDKKTLDDENNQTEKPVRSSGKRIKSR